MHNIVESEENVIILVQGRIHRGHRGHVPLPYTHENFFKHEDNFLCSLIQHTEYCSCCASFKTIRCQSV